MNLFFGIVLAVCLAGPALAQEAEPEAGLVALHQACLDAATDVVVLNVAAHPDDESSRTNTILRRKHGMRIVTVYSTYGDGGQNAIGREIGPELADLRVRETLRAAAMSGVEVRWLGMPDFGFSKTLDETLLVWGAERLKDAMREVLDHVDPDVVITNHSLKQGHGHHRASFWAMHELLREREQKGAFVPRLYGRCARADSQLTLDPAELDPARGETFARLAHRAWTQHVTQGPWGPHNALQVGKDYWRVVHPEGLSAAQAADLSSFGRGTAGGAFGAVEPLQLSRTALGDEARMRLVATRAEIAALKGKLDNGAARKQARLLYRRQKALERVLLALANVRAEVWLERDTVAFGDQGKAFVVLHGVERVEKLIVRCGGVEAVPAATVVRATPFDGATPAGDGGTNGSAPTSSTAPPTAPPTPLPTAPLTPPPTPTTPPPTTPSPAPIPGRFSVEFAAIGEPEEDEVRGPETEFVEVDVSFELDGLPFTILPTLPYTPVPTMAMHWDREVLLVPRGKRVDVMLSASVRANKESGINTAVRLSMGPGIQATSMPGRLVLTREHDEARILVAASIDAAELLPDATLEIGFREASARIALRVIDVTVPDGMRVALVRGPDDTTERTLGDLGIPFVALDRDALLSAELDEFSAILLDIRAYHHRPELAEVRDRLLQYCRAGGRIVVMYHKSGEWNERAGKPTLAPFPLVVGDERVTEEDAAVTMLVPEHRLLQHPHALRADDFDGWVQERGLNFPKTWDEAWTPLLSMKDSGDAKALTGSLLHTQYGRGDFVYCSLALYRQLRIGNPGASRLLVNLLAR